MAFYFLGFGGGGVLTEEGVEFPIFMMPSPTVVLNRSGEKVSLFIIVLVNVKVYFFDIRVYFIVNLALHTTRNPSYKFIHL